MCVAKIRIKTKVPQKFHKKLLGHHPYFTPQRAEPLFIYSFIDSEVPFFWASFTALTDTAT